MELFQLQVEIQHINQLNKQGQLSTNYHSYRFSFNRLRPLVLHENQLSQNNTQRNHCMGILPGRVWVEYQKFKLVFIHFCCQLVPIPKADELTEVYKEKLRLLRKLKPQYFDNQGNLISNNRSRTFSQSPSSAPSSKK